MVIQQSVLSAAGLVSSQLQSQFQNVSSAAEELFKNGRPATPQLGYPALTPDNINSALGEDAKARILGAIAVLEGKATATPIPTPAIGPETPPAS